MAGRADYWADGQWNFYCDLCGRKAKSSDGVKTWDSFYVCRHHKEVRNPQDFLRGVREKMSVPWTRPLAVLPIPYTCTLWGRSAYAEMGVADCAQAGFAPASYGSLLELAYPPNGIIPANADYNTSGVPGYGIPGFAIPNNALFGPGNV
jgi:hypothetical protein